MLPNTSAPKIGLAMAEAVERVNGEPIDAQPLADGTELARLREQVAHYKALANGDGAELDKLTRRIDELSRENRDLKRAAESPKPEYVKEGQIEVVPLKAIIRDAGTQSRALLDEKTVERYMSYMEAGDKFPPLRGVQTGQGIVLRDGFHRFEAMMRLGWKDCRIDVIQGSLSDAIWLSLSANKEHDKSGLARSNGDKRRAVERALAHPNAAQLSSREIGRHVGVSHTFIDRVRKELSGNGCQIDTPTAPRFPQPPAVPVSRMVTRSNGAPYAMNTSNIGKSAAPRTQVRADEFSQRAPDDDAPLVDADADEGVYPPFDDTPDLPPAVPKAAQVPPIPQAPRLPQVAPPVPQVEQPSEAERAAALAARQALMTAQPSVAVSATEDGDSWADVMVCRDAIIRMIDKVESAFGISTAQKQVIIGIGCDALKKTDHR